MRHPFSVVFIAFLAGLAGGLIGVRLVVAQPVLAQSAPIPNVVRAKRFELIDPKGTTRAVLDATDNQLPRLEFDEPDGSRVLINAAMLQFKHGNDSAMISTLGAMFSGENKTVLLDPGNSVLGALSGPGLSITDKGYFAQISSVNLTFTDAAGKTVWETPLRLPQ